MTWPRKPPSAYERELAEGFRARLPKGHIKRAAFKAGMSCAHLNEILNGQRRITSWAVANRISRAIP